jgi:hypothetical protein
MTKDSCRRRWARCDAPPLPSSSFVERRLRLQSNSAVPKISFILLVHPSPRLPKELHKPILSLAPPGDTFHCQPIFLSLRLFDIARHPLCDLHQAALFERLFRRRSSQRLRRVQTTRHYLSYYHPITASFCRLKLFFWSARIFVVRPHPQLVTPQLARFVSVVYYANHYAIVVAAGIFYLIEI